MSTIIFHIDVNSAFLSWSAVKQLEEGSSVDLREIPSIVGGDSATRHGIVTARSIPAKKYGIVTAEPVASAMRKCPGLVMVPPDGAYYSKMSHMLMDFLRQYTPDIEQLSIDECFMDFGPIAHKYPSPVAAATEIKDAVKEYLGFTVNIGISTNRLLAKMASDFEKPNKVHTLFPEEIEEKMWPLDVGDLMWVGKSSAARLKSLGIKTIGDLANTPVEFLTAHFKSHGQGMWESANGISDDTLHLEHAPAKGIGHSTTMAKDATSKKDCEPVLRVLADQVAARLRKAQKLAGCVTLEIKYNDFVSCSRQTSELTPDNSSTFLYEVALRLFDELWNGTPIRLLGIRATKLCELTEPVQLSLFDATGAIVSVGEKQTSEKEEKLAKALDSIRGKYGKYSVSRGTQIEKKKTL